MTRPVRNNANRNPAQILKDAAPPRRTSAQKQADDAKAAAKKAEIEEKASEIRQEGVRKIAAMEGLLRRQDHAYGTNVPRGLPEKKQILASEKHDEDEDTDGEYELSSAHSESVSSELPSDDQSAGSESEARRKSHKAKSHKTKGNKRKERLLRQEVAANRKTVASAGSLARKCKNENVNGEIDVNASERVPQHKRAKATQLASNLNPDWQKTVGLLVKGSASRNLKSLDTDEVDTSLIPQVERSQPSSRASSRAGSRSTPDTSSDLVVGEFDLDEPEETIAAAREHKSTKVKDVKTSARYRTTAGMGLKINKKGADDAVTEEVKAVKMLKPQKPLRKLRLEDLPLQDKSDRDVWNRLVCAVIDWAGTTTDPFGTNEHPELSPKLQELWNVFFEHNTVDINEHPAIKKIATDRLNEWRSMFGKDALKILKRHFKHPEFRHDLEARVKFVRDHLPRKVNNQKRVPFIYADIEAFKGAWLSPELLELVAGHIKRCGKAFGVFGKPIGALGLAAAAYHRALSLYTDGKSAKEAAKEAKRHGNSDNAGGKNSKNIDFDTAWGSVTMRYAEQASGLPASKWDSIEEALSELIGTDTRSDDGDYYSDDDIMDIRGVVLLSDGEDDGPQPIEDLDGC
ncbi:hypothetical protein DEU56DRAFT_935813 [Suillus clintonianus]|uniref:uncharacterized protein n=1 Tax=Suillus clintonianus TaxID=1904413 RepID=UPI001B87DF2B|nr:uncharacterized protein DEU56DRAFT_935813 [Suillus clintonianus]KAG2144613.1 hypothetical protein DEU56DRAFT_935813 [Suillus clintonianus]